MHQPVFHVVLHGVALQNLFWLLEDAPLTTYLPILGTITFMHLLSYIQSYSAVLYQPLQLLGNLGLYVSLGELAHSPVAAISQTLAAAGRSCSHQPVAEHIGRPDILLILHAPLAPCCKGRMLQMSLLLTVLMHACLSSAQRSCG